MSITTEFAVIKSGIDEEVALVMRKHLEKNYGQAMSYGNVHHPSDGKYKSDDEIRKSKISWVPTTSWVAGMLANFITAANVDLFGYDLLYWTDEIQYTSYDESGSHYTWHNDMAKASNKVFGQDIYRKLSISLCLSHADEYDGGEFQLMTQCNQPPATYKMDMGDVIVFSSDTTHRVRPIKSGKRISLVGWYGGPKFK